MSEVERESMEVDVLYVGAGPANLASAYHLMKQVGAYNQKAEATGDESIEPPTVLVIEKSAGVGDHMLSGAVINPRGIQELMPDFVEQGLQVSRIVDSNFTDGGAAVWFVFNVFILGFAISVVFDREKSGSKKE